MDMILDNIPTYELLQKSVRVCQHCKHYQTHTCLRYPAPPENFQIWNPACDIWSPNTEVDLVLQELLMRKLSGREITSAGALAESIISVK